MQLFIRKLTCLALVAGVLLSASSAIETKVTRCCTKVSTLEFSAPIIEYWIQKRNLPCVRAVVFSTSEGDKCSHLKEPWVLEKIKEFHEIRKAKRSQLSTLPTPQTYNSTTVQQDNSTTPANMSTTHG